jgi:diaminopimelate epimerase
VNFSPISNTLPIFKYHGLGNDFVVMRGRDLRDSAGRESDLASWAGALCDRHRGIGADGLLVVTLSDDAESAARMVIYNQDGSRPEMCGNGVRCVVRHLVEVEGIAGDELIIASDAGPRRCRVVERNRPQESGVWQVEVDMGPATIASGRVEFKDDDLALSLVDVDMGNPHAVALNASADAETLDRAGGILNSAHPAFPSGVNLEFVQQMGPQKLRVDVFERGVGRTMACGTGACAAAAAAIDAGLCDAQAPVEVELPGGALTIEMRDGRVWMRGPVESVFRGELHESQIFKPLS